MIAPELPEVASSREAVLACLAEALSGAGVSNAGLPLTDDMSLDGDMGVDSFQLMQVARHLEKTYSYRFSVADWVLAEEASENPSYRVGGLVDFVCTELTKTTA
jgi:acyl carrier protein